MKRITMCLSGSLLLATLVPGQPHAADLTTLVSFDGVTAAYPFAGLIADAKGNLFGTTGGGGDPTCGSSVFGLPGCGTVFEIAKTPEGYASTPTVLVNFSGIDGAFPAASLLADAQGNLFGTTALGGTDNFGTVFEIKKTPTGYENTPTVLVSFNGANGEFPQGNLIIDANGNLFGTTFNSLGQGGNLFGGGGVFEIVKTLSGYDSTPTVLVSFCASCFGEPAFPESGLIADAGGNLFGTAGGGTNFIGTVYEVPKIPGRLRRYRHSSGEPRPQF